MTYFSSWQTSSLKVDGPKVDGVSRALYGCVCLFTNWERSCPAGHKHLRGKRQERAASLQMYVELM